MGVERGPILKQSQSKVSIQRGRMGLGSSKFTRLGIQSQMSQHAHSVISQTASNTNAADQNKSIDTEWKPPTLKERA